MNDTIYNNEGENNSFMKTTKHIEDVECIIPIKSNGNGKNGGKCPQGIDSDIVLLSQSIDIMREEQKSNFSHITNEVVEIKEEIKKMGETILEPEKGLYGRVKTVEMWNSIITKVFWITLTSLIGFIITKMFIIKSL